VLALHQQGVTLASIAHRLNLTSATFRRIVRSGADQAGVRARRPSRLAQPNTICGRAGRLAARTRLCCGTKSRLRDARDATYTCIRATRTPRLANGTRPACRTACSTHDADTFPPGRSPRPSARQCDARRVARLRRRSGFPEFQGFANGLRKDLEAVNAALTWNLSNGQTQGHVNRLKKLNGNLWLGGTRPPAVIEADR
jgi:hypothetical protein